MGTPVAMVVDLFVADKASAVEFPPINDLFKIFRFESVAVWSFAFLKQVYLKYDYQMTLIQCLPLYKCTCFLAIPRGGFTAVSTYANCVFRTGVDAAWLAFIFCRSLANFTSRSSRHR